MNFYNIQYSPIKNINYSNQRINIIKKKIKIFGSRKINNDTYKEVYKYHSIQQ